MPGLQSVRNLGIICLGLAVWPALSGCADKAAKPQENPAPDHLRKIAQAFDIAQHKNGHPPRDVDEIKPALKLLSPKEEPDTFLRSPNDGEPYEIMWGVNLDRQTELGLILAHEQKGANGKRYVINVARIVLQIDDAQFESAVFARAQR